MINIFHHSILMNYQINEKEVATCNKFIDAISSISLFNPYATNFIYIPLILLVDELLKLLEDYSFFRLDEKGTIVDATGEFEKVIEKNFNDIVLHTDKKKIARAFIELQRKKVASAKLLMNIDGRKSFKISFVKGDGEILGVAKRLDVDEPSFISDFMGNIIYAKEEWKDLEGKNIFDLAENRESLLDAIEDAIREGECEKEIFINDKKALVKIKVNDNIEFYIKEDIFSFIKDILRSKNEEELLQNVKKAVEALKIKYEINGGEDAIHLFPIYKEDKIEYQIAVYEEIDEKKRNLLQFISTSASATLEKLNGFEKILQHFPIYKIDEKGFFVYVNDKFEELIGYSFSELKNKKVDELAEKRNEFFEKLKNGKIENFVSKWKGKGKEVFVCEYAWKLNGETIVLLQDITKEKEKEREAEFYNSLLRHDIFNKNEIALGYIGLLEKTNLTKKQKEFLKKIRDAIADSNRLIENIRKAEEIRKSKSKLESINLKEIVEKICEEFEEEALKRNVKISYNLDDAIVYADNLIKEVFSNLIKNALQHAECNNIMIYGEFENNYYKVYVEDDGKGIDEEDLPKIFEEGWRKDGGSGLGLYIVKKLMERYNGKIDVESKVGKGTKFILYFKLARKKAKKEFLKIRF